MSAFVVAPRVTFLLLGGPKSTRAGGDSSVGPTLVREQQPPLSTVLAYMQLLEDYSEPQPSMFYQTPQSEHIYQQKNKMLMEVYGFSDSFCGSDSTQELAPPPALPPKQRQLVSSSPSVSLALLPVLTGFQELEWSLWGQVEPAFYPWWNPRLRCVQVTVSHVVPPLPSQIFTISLSLTLPSSYPGDKGPPAVTVLCNWTCTQNVCFPC